MTAMTVTLTALREYEAVVLSAQECLPSVDKQRAVVGAHSAQSCGYCAAIAVQVKFQAERRWVGVAPERRGIREFNVALERLFI